MRILVVVLVGVLVVACGKQAETSAQPKFDAKFIAAEADKGNLAPLDQLNQACLKEVEKVGARSSICKVQDEVGKLTRPLGVRF